MKNNKVYEKNMNAIREQNIYLWNSLKDIDKEIKWKPICENSMNGEWIVGVHNEEEQYWLNSQYDAKQAVDAWIEGVCIDNYQSVIMVLGFSNGMYIESLLKKYAEHTVIVYEPNAEMFQLVMKNRDISDLFKKKSNLFIAVGEKGYALWTEYIQAMVTFANLRWIEWYAIPTYKKIYAEEYVQLLNIFTTWGSQLTLSRNTLILFQEEFATNILSNIYDLICNYSVNSVKKSLKKYIQGEHQRPAIVVAAGPSLDKNIFELKNAKGKAFIIAVDTAIKPLLRAGIKPDIAISVDPHKPISLFEIEGVDSFPMVCCEVSNVKVLRRLKSKHIYYAHGEKYIASMLSDYKKEMSGLESGGSVACDAFSLAQYLGFQTIILVGQDLAYPNAKGHASEAYDGKENIKIEKNQKYFEIEDIYGNKVLTEGNMNAYRKWFESQIVRYEKLHVIDATEGGAKIAGTEIMTLQDCIARECENMRVVDYAEILDEIKPIFTPEQMEEIRTNLYNMPNKLKEIRKHLEDGIKLYQRLKKYSQTKKFDKVKLMKVYDQIKESNDWVEKQPESSLINMYNYNSEYEVLGNIYNQQEEWKDEIAFVVKNGIKMYQSYLNALEILEKNLHVLYDSIEEKDKEKLC